MKNFSDYLKKEDLLKKLFEYYRVDPEEIDTHKFLVNLIKEIDVVSYNFKVLNSNYEFLGTIYEEFLHRDERKRLGQFYTPKSVVSYILDAVGYRYNKKIENKKLIDLSCGVGNFVLQSTRILILRYLQIYKRKTIQDLLLIEAKSIVSRIKEGIYGIDINPIACVLCQINIHYLLFGIFKLIKNEEDYYHLPLFNIKNINAMTIDKSEQFDIIVGNPPYLFIRDIPKVQRQIIKNMNFKTGQGQYDYFQIFIELGIKLLKNKGQLGYIVPDSLLALSNRSILRKFIFDTTKIKEIYHSGPQFEDPVVSNIIIILEKEPNIEEREKNRIKVKIINQHQKEILQKSLKNWNYKFLIHLNDEDISIIIRLTEKFPKLRELMVKDGFKFLLSRGVELTKNGEIIYCKHCKKYFPIPKKEFLCPDCKTHLREEFIEKIIVNSLPKKNRENFKLFVDSIQRYKVREYEYIELKKNGINYKNLEIYEDRVIIRQLNQNNLICATYDKNLSLTSQSFYNLKVCKSPINELNNIYLLGIINSKLLSYYFIQLFGSYKKLFPRILIEKIKDLPIKVPEKEKEKEIALKIIEKVKILLYADENGTIKLNQIQREIDDLIFSLYDINYNDKQYIINFMAKI
jgi:hypothetical protein